MTVKLAVSFLLMFLVMQVAAAGAAFAAVSPSDAALPRELGIIDRRVQGTPGQPIIFIIGEQHVSLPVQKTVADILRYLTGAYDVQLVCFEGYDKPLKNVAHGTSITVVRRFVASADLAARRTSGVEYFAIANPEIDVIGVEDMEAYKAHREVLLQVKESQESQRQWEEDFAKFLKEDLTAIVTPQNQDAIEDALKKQEDDFGSFAEGVYSVAGETSWVGHRLFYLQQRHDELENAAHALAGRLKSHEQDRDEAMVMAMLGTIEKKKVESAVLVVGRMHLKQIGKILTEREIPFVEIIVSGAQEEVSDEDQRIDQEWRQGKQTGLEQWLSHIKHIKPPPASARPTYQDRTAVLSVLAVADHLRSGGMSQRETLSVVRTSALPARVKIEQIFDIEGGVGIAFSEQGRKAYAYFGEAANRVQPPQAPQPVEAGSSGGRYYAIYTGSGGGKEPPIPPRRPSSSSPAEPSGPRPTGIATEGFLVGYKEAIADQRQQRPERVTILYRIENGNLVRYVNDKGMPLYATPDDVAGLVKSYREAPLGPEKLFRAQKLADVLLVDIDSQFPDKAREIVVISQDNLLKDVALPMLGAMAGRKDATKLSSPDLMTRSYVLNTSQDKVDLSVLAKGLKDTKKAEKTKAMEEIEQNTTAKKTTLKELLSKPPTKTHWPWMNSLEQLARSTEEAG